MCMDECLYVIVGECMSDCMGLYVCSACVCMCECLYVIVSVCMSACTMCLYVYV